MRGIYLTSALGKAIEAAVGFAVIIFLIRVAIIVSIAALIVWIAKKIWYAGSNNTSPKKKSKVHDQWTEDWVYNASARQNNRYEYSDPVKEPKWTYNERARMWVDAEQMEQERHKQAYEENRRRWQAYEEGEAERERAIERERQTQREEQRFIDELHRERDSIILTDEEQNLAKQIRVDRSMPSFEEWKAEKKNKR